MKLGAQEKRKHPNRAHFSKEFCFKIHQFIATSLFTIEKLGQAVGVHRGTLVHWMNGTNKATIDDPRVLKMADIVGIQKERIFE